MTAPPAVEPLERHHVARTDVPPTPVVPRPVHTESSDAATPSPPRPSWPVRARAVLLNLIFPAVVLGVGIAVFLVMAALQAPPKKRSDVLILPTVEVVEATPHTGGVVIRSDGLVVPVRDVTIPAQVAGQIVEKNPNCRPGFHVNEGDVLFRIEPRDFVLEQRRAEADLKSAEATIRELDAEIQTTQQLRDLGQQQVELTLTDYRRREQAGIFVAGEMDKAYQNILTAKNSLAQVDQRLATMRERRSQLEQQRDTAASRVETAQLNLDRATIVAPISGTVIESQFETNNYVSAGQSLAMIQDTSTMEVACKMRLREMYWIWQHQFDPEAAVTTAMMTDPTGGPAVGASNRLTEAAAEMPPQAAQVLTSMLPGLGPAGQTDGGNTLALPPTPVIVVHELLGKKYRWRGVLSRYDGAGLDPQTRQVPCIVTVPNPREVLIEDANGTLVPATGGPPSLLRNMYVTVRITANPPIPMLRLPDMAIQPGSRVWRVRQPNSAEVEERQAEEIARKAEATPEPSQVERLLATVGLDRKPASAETSESATPEGERRLLESVPIEILQSDGGVTLVQGLDDSLQAGDQVVISPIVNPVNAMWVQLARTDTSDLEKRLTEGADRPMDITERSGAATPATTATDVPVPRASAPSN